MCGVKMGVGFSSRAAAKAPPRSDPDIASSPQKHARGPMVHGHVLLSCNGNPEASASLFSSGLHAVWEDREVHEMAVVA